MKEPLWRIVLGELLKGRTFSQYPTGDVKGYDSYYRWDDNKEVIPSRTVIALVNKEIISIEDIKISSEVIP